MKVVLILTDQHEKIKNPKIVEKIHPNLIEAQTKGLENQKNAETPSEFSLHELFSVFFFY
jgi:uncharacterized membrane-anchored protein